MPGLTVDKMASWILEMSSFSVLNTDQMRQAYETNNNKPGSRPALRVDSTLGRSVFTVVVMAAHPGFTAATTTEFKQTTQNKVSPEASTMLSI
jgi:hypothetical protein